MKKSTLIGIILTLIYLACTNKILPLLSPDGTEEYYQVSKNPFYHGVASGDPLHNAVIIWTRVTPEQHGIVPVQWEVSESQTFEPALQSGIVTTDNDRDYTVKIDIQNLKPSQRYYYRFKAFGKNSETGKTKTLPEGFAEGLSLGIVSCSNYEFGYFNAYDGLIDADVDVVLHLGDYIYEYGPDAYGDSNFVRKHLPAKEILTLQDYRTRYAQYRLDGSLQRAHQMLPFIVIWDDHEIANNAYKTGAQNHQEEEGDYQERKKIARQVYYEWQPIRETSNKELYRNFQFGELAEIFMLDERFTGRNAPPSSSEELSVSRSMLGSSQLKWLKKGLTKSQARWKILGNQVIFSPCDLSLVRPNSPVNFDAWDGYAAERDDIITHLTNGSIKNVVFVTGDTHASWAFEVPSDYKTYGEDPAKCAIEIATPSITSSNWNDGGNSDMEVKMGEQALLSSNPHLKYVNGRDHGFTILSLSLDEARADWYYTSDIKKKSADIRLAHSMTFKANKHK